jgi:integrase
MKNDIDVFELSLLAQRATTALLKKHRRSVAANTVLPSATPEQRELALRKFSDEELIARAKRAAPATVQRMETRASAVFAEADVAGISVWTLVEQKSGNYDSWYTFKACVQRYLEDEIAKTKRQLDLWQRARKSNGPSPDSANIGSGLVMRLDALAAALMQVPAGAPERFKGDGKSKRYPRNSKSASIRTVDDNWRECAAGEMEGSLKVLFLLQCVTGCRPQELENGVQVRLLRDGTMVTRVIGAKSDEVAGQPSRCLRVLVSEGVCSMLARLLKVGQTLDSRRCNLGRVNTYATRVARACKAAFPDRKGRRKFSSYSVRHQFKADLLAAGWDASAIGMAMGHSTTRSGKAYGRGGRGGGRGVRPVAVKARRPVNLRATPPMAKRAAVAPTNTTSPKPSAPVPRPAKPRSRRPRP